MTTCSSCGASLADDTAFCSACGRAVVQGTPGVTIASVQAPAQPTRVLSPEATQAMRQAAVRAQTVAMNLGPDKIAGIVGGVLGILGAILPFYAMPTDSLFGASGTSSPSLVSEGGTGVVVILLAIVLGAEPFFMVPTRLISLIEFGLAAGVIGMLLGDRFGFSLFGQSVPIDFGMGFYLGLLGFAILAYGHGRRAFKAT